MKAPLVVSGDEFQVFASGEQLRHCEEAGRRNSLLTGRWSKPMQDLDRQDLVVEELSSPIGQEEQSAVGPAQLG